MNKPKLIGIIKDASKTAREIYSIVKRKTSGLDWMTNLDMKTKIIEHTKEETIDDYKLRDQIPKAYKTNDEMQLWWKVFHKEYAILKERDEL